MAGAPAAHHFYLYLAAALTVLVVMDAFTSNAVVDMRQKTYDLMTRYRYREAGGRQPDRDRRFNEASLAAMAPDYGRWPWPRQVLGEFVQHLEAQRPEGGGVRHPGPDLDVYNADSDTYFNEAIAATDNTYFPWLRLAPASDSRPS